MSKLTVGCAGCGFGTELHGDNCRVKLVKCACHACIEQFDLKAVAGDDFFSQLPLSSSRMIICPGCGYKRCPKASNHRNKCTDSNKPGQEGSIYKQKAEL